MARAAAPRRRRQLRDSRRGSVDALDQLFEKVAPQLGAQPAELEAVAGTVRVKGDPAKA